jgi:hypothetical protein
MLFIRKIVLGQDIALMGQLFRDLLVPGKNRGDLLHKVQHG